ncbi:MAG: hypothetical protein R3E32_25030 [Chitinophagales bacterium]
MTGNTTTMIEDSKEESQGAMTFENLDNDDKDNLYDGFNGWTLGWPTDEVNGGDDELVKIIAKVKPLNIDQSKITLEAIKGHLNISIWKSNDKSAGQYNLGDPLTFTSTGEWLAVELWVEGTKPHTKQQGTILSLKYENGGEGACAEDKVAITIVGVDELRWKGKKNGFSAFTPGGLVNISNTLDADPVNYVGTGVNNNRVFVGARKDNPTIPRNKVELEVELSVIPIHSLSIYLRSFDIDDPSSDLGFIDPNDGGITTTGYYSGTNNTISYTPHEDNRGEVKGLKAGYIDKQNTQGIATMVFGTSSKIEKIDFTTTLHAGDSFRVVANGDKDFLNSLENLDQLDHFKIADPKVSYPLARAEVLLSDKYTSPILCVWRILHIEHDAMQDYSWGGTIGHNFQRQGVFTDIEDLNPSSSFVLSSSVKRLSKPKGKYSSLVNENLGGSYYVPFFLDESLNLASTSNGRFEKGDLELGYPTSISFGGTDIRGNGGDGNSIGNIFTNQFIEFSSSKNIVGSGMNCNLTTGTKYKGTVNSFYKDKLTGKFHWDITVPNVSDLTIFNGGQFSTGGSINIATASTKSIVTDKLLI